MVIGQSLSVIAYAIPARSTTFTDLGLSRHLGGVSGVRRSNRGPFENRKARTTRRALAVGATVRSFATQVPVRCR